MRSGQLGIGLTHADLFDNYDQLRQRYGDPVSHTVSDDGTLFTLYRCRPFRVLVGFLQGCSHHEAFKRLDGAPMTTTDMEKCLPFEKWKKVSIRTWEYQGRTALAGIVSPKVNSEFIRVNGGSGTAHIARLASRRGSRPPGKVIKKVENIQPARPWHVLGGLLFFVPMPDSPSKKLNGQDSGRLRRG